jgi:aryl-alcohol dehydrogenase-like predicted oxidoreductase
MITRRKLGPNLEVSEVGFGTWGLGGDSYGPAPEPEAIEALQSAFERGVNFYDTSDLYGDGRSEIIVGKAFKTIRQKVVIGTKVGFIPKTKEQNFSTSHILKSLEASLSRLQTDYIDLYQLHSPPLEALSDELLKTFGEIKKSGKAREIGISVRNPSDGIQAIEKFGFRSIQANFNMIDQRPLDNGLLDLAEKRNVGIIARTPFCFGFLTGRYSESTFSENDHRAQWPTDQIERWAKAPQLFEPLYLEGKRTPIELALQYCLSFKGISTVIPGMMNPKQVDENLSAANSALRLSQSDVDFIRKVYKEHFSAPPKKQS